MSSYPTTWCPFANSLALHFLSLQVRVLVPDAKGGRIEVAVLGRGQFVGERSVINDKLRSADCVAQGRVQVRNAVSRPLSVWLVAWLFCCINGKLRSADCVAQGHVQVRNYFVVIVIFL